MNALKMLCNVFDGINEWVGRIVSWVTLGLVLIVFSDVVMRYLFNTSFVFVQELEWHVFGFIFLMGAGYTLLHDGHVRVDIIYQNRSPRAQAWINLLGVLFFMLPGCLMVIVTSWKFTSNSWMIMEGSPDPGGIPFRFLLKGTITTGFVLLFLQGISIGLRSLLLLAGIEKAEEKAS